ncbi:hypothetical protein R1sor_021490 [Riccia sorocarpa]|uniref:Uncharacterized protein n=1 Tax=Riccia sorocarpa TaxID=122646 RepID=A0ABD3GLF4_9MARC
MARSEDLESCLLPEKGDARSWSRIQQRLRWQSPSADILHYRTELLFLSVWMEALSRRLEAVKEGTTGICWKIIQNISHTAIFLCSLPLHLADWIYMAISALETGVADIWWRSAQALREMFQSLCNSYFEVLHPFVSKLLAGCGMIIRVCLVVVEIFGWIAGVVIYATVYFSTFCIAVGLTSRLILQLQGNSPSSIYGSDEIPLIRVFISQAVLAAVTAPISFCLYARKARIDERFLDFAADYTRSRENPLVLRIVTCWALSFVLSFLGAVLFWLFLVMTGIILVLFVLLLYGVFVSVESAAKWIDGFATHFLSSMARFWRNRRIHQELSEQVDMIRSTCYLLQKGER